MRLAGRTRYPDVYYDRTFNNSYLVRDPDPAERRQFARLLGACACIFVVVFGVALLHVECQHFGYENSQLKAESAQLNDANQKLRLEQASLTDPERIDRLARQDLGLAPSQPQQIVHLSDTAAPPQSDSAAVIARAFTTLTRQSKGASREP